MKYDRNRSFSRKALYARGTRVLLGARARELAPGVAAATRIDSGETRASTHVETGHVANDGRPAARIVQTGAPVPENFRQNRDYMLRGLAAGA